MAVISELQAPDQVHAGERGFTARWTHVADLAPEYDGAKPRTANVVLSVSHVKRRHGGFIGASLMNESEHADGIRSVLFDFRTNKAVTLVEEAAPRLNRKRVRAVLDEAIAETQRLYAEGDERVLALWQGVGCST